MTVVAANVQHVPQNERVIRQCRWCQMVLKALRPVTASFLEVLQGSTGSMWTRALRRARPNEELLEVIEDSTAATQVVHSWVNAGARAAPASQAPSMSRALSRMNKAELQQEVQRQGFDPSDPALSTSVQLYAFLKLLEQKPGAQGDRNQIKGLGTMSKAKLRELCTERGILWEGLTCDQMRLSLKGWIPPTIPMTLGSKSMTGASSSSSATTAPKAKAPAMRPSVTGNSQGLPRPAMPIYSEMSTPPARRGTENLPPVSPGSVMSTDSTTRPPALLCPIHQQNMILKKNRHDASLFWGCPQYPACKITTPLEAMAVQQDMNNQASVGSAQLEEERQRLVTAEAELERQRTEVQQMALNAQNAYNQAYAEIQAQQNATAQANAAVQMQAQQQHQFQQQLEAQHVIMQQQQQQQQQQQHQLMGGAAMPAAQMPMQTPAPLLPD